MKDQVTIEKAIDELSEGLIAARRFTEELAVHSAKLHSHCVQFDNEPHADELVVACGRLSEPAAEMTGNIYDALFALRRAERKMAALYDHVAALKRAG